MKKREYTVDQYKDIIAEFIKEYPQYSAKLNKEDIWNEDLYNLDSNDQLLDFVIKKICRKSKSLHFLEDIRSALNCFFEWSVKKGYISYNPFIKKEYEYKRFIYAFVDEMDITFVYDDTIETIISKLKMNKDFNEVLIRGFYEGIGSVKNLLNLRWEEVDYNNSTILINGEEKKMSSKFFEALKRYEYVKDFEAVRGINNNYFTLSLYIYDGHVFKYTCNNIKSEEEYMQKMRVFITKSFKKLSKKIIDIDYQMLSISGFINFVKERCKTLEKDDEYFISMFNFSHSGPCPDHSYTVRDLWHEYFKENKSISSIRKICYPYVVKSKYYR